MPELEHELGLGPGVEAEVEVELGSEVGHLVEVEAKPDPEDDSRGTQGFQAGPLRRESLG